MCQKKNSFQKFSNTSRTRNVSQLWQRKCQKSLLSCNHVYSRQWRILSWNMGHSRLRQAVKLFQITPDVSDFQTLNNPGSWQPVGASKIVLPYIFDTRDHAVITTLSLTTNGVWSNLQVEGHNAGAKRRPNFFFDVPPHFSLVPPHEGGTTIVCYRLRDNWSGEVGRGAVKVMGPSTYSSLLMLTAFLVRPLQEGHGCITSKMIKYSYWTLNVELK